MEILDPFKLRHSLTLEVLAVDSDGHYLSMGDRRLTGALNVRQRSLRIQIVSRCPNVSARRHAVYQSLFKVDRMGQLEFWQAEVIIRMLKAYGQLGDDKYDAFERLETAIAEYS